MKKILVVCLFLFILSAGSAFAIAMPAVSLPKISLPKQILALPKAPVTIPGVVKNMNPLTVAPRSVVGVPMISGNYIVWQDSRNVGTNGSDIYGMDKTTGKEFIICDKPGNQTSPFIYGDVVVWTDSNTSVHAYSISAKSEFTLKNTGANSKIARGISENYILWQEYLPTPSNYRLMAYNYLNPNPNPRIIAFSLLSSTNSAIDGNIVVWTDNKNGSQNFHVYAYDLSLNKEIAVSTGTAKQLEPTVSEDMIVWKDYRSNSLGDIWGYYISTGKESLIYSPSSGSIVNPYVGKRYVVFEKDNRIYAYHIDTKILSQVSDSLHNYANPSIKNNVVVWANDGTVTNGNIFTATLPDVPAVKSFVIGDGATQRFYVNKVKWVFNTDTNVSTLISDGSIVNAVKITNLGTRAKTSSISQDLILNASDFSYDAGTRTLTWNYHTTATDKSVPAGLFRATLFASYITSSADNTHAHPVGDIVNYFHRLNCDANGDMIVDRSDLAILSDSFGSKLGDANWNPNADFNRNLVVDVMDYLELKTDFGSYIETL